MMTQPTACQAAAVPLRSTFPGMSTSLYQPQIQPIILQSILPSYPKIQILPNDLISKRRSKRDNPLKILKNKRFIEFYTNLRGLVKVPGLTL